MAFQGSMFSLDTSQVFTQEKLIPQIIRRRDEELTLAQYVMKVTDFPTADLVRRPYISDLGVHDKALKSPVTYQAVTDSEWSMIVDRYKESSILVEDIIEDRAVISLRSEYTRRCAFALARDIDYAILGMRAAVSSYNSGSHHVISAEPISLAEIQAAYEILLRQRTPGPFYLVIGIPHMASMWNIEEFKNSLYTDERILSTGRVSRIMGDIEVVRTNNLVANSATGLYNGENDPSPSPTPGMASSLYLPTQEDITVSTYLTAGYTTAMLMTKEAFVMAMEQAPEVEISRMPEYKATGVITTQRYGIKSLRLNECVLISTDEDAAI